MTPCDQVVQLDFVAGWFIGLCVQACCVPAATIVLTRYPGERAIVGYATLAAAILFPVAIFALLSNTGRCIVG